jgi:hypothetical protein
MSRCDRLSRSREPTSARYGTTRWTWRAIWARPRAQLLAAASDPRWRGGRIHTDNDLRMGLSFLKKAGLAV